MTKNNLTGTAPFECVFCGCKDYIKKEDNDEGPTGGTVYITRRVCAGCGSFSDVM